VFLENVTDPRLVKSIASESGAKVGGTLYSDALSSPDGPGGSYIEMMRNNIRELSAALAQ
jgi:zinc/manganese transport system substrate-binding protein